MIPFEVLQNAEMFHTKKICVLQNLRRAPTCKSLNWANLILQLKILAELKLGKFTRQQVSLSIVRGL